MALSTAERQARYRERRKAQGLKRKDEWQDAAGFLPADAGEAETRPRLDYNGFIKELKELVKPMRELEAEEIYAELLTRARQLREGWNRIDGEINRIVEGEKERGNWRRQEAARNVTGNGGPKYGKKPPYFGPPAAVL